MAPLNKALGNSAMPTIAGREGVERIFGEWPSFHDAHLVGVSLQASGVSKGSTSCLALRIYHCTPATEWSDSIHYEYVSKNRTIITLRFDHVRELELNELREGNILDGLVLTDAVDARGQSCISVDLNGCYGADGKFQCDAVAVVKIETLEDTVA
jgi:hypothetical protein